MCQYDPVAMPTNRRARPTIRCLTEDLGLELPGLRVDLGEIDDSWMDELRRIAPISPQGQKRVLSIAHPLVFRLRVSSFRGATWVDGETTSYGSARSIAVSRGRRRCFRVVRRSSRKRRSASVQGRLAALPR